MSVMPPQQPGRQRRARPRSPRSRSGTHAAILPGLVARRQAQGACGRSQRGRASRSRRARGAGSSSAAAPSTSPDSSRSSSAAVGVHLVAGVAADPVDLGQRQPDLGGQRLGHRHQPGRLGEPDEGAVDGEVGGGQLGGADPLLAASVNVVERLAYGVAGLLAGGRPSVARRPPRAPRGPRRRRAPRPGRGSVTWTPRFGSRVASPSATSTAERLADRGPGDPHGVGQRDLAQRRTGLDLAVEQRPAQLLGHPVHGRGVLQGERLERVTPAPPRRAACHDRGPR